MSWEPMWGGSSYITAQGQGELMRGAGIACTVWKARFAD